MITGNTDFDAYLWSAADDGDFAARVKREKEAINRHLLRHEHIAELNKALQPFYRRYERLEEICDKMRGDPFLHLTKAVLTI